MRTPKRCLKYASNRNFHHQIIIIIIIIIIILKQWSAYIINNSACIINVWGYTEIFPRPLKSHDFVVRLTVFSSISRSHDKTGKSHYK